MRQDKLTAKPGRRKNSLAYKENPFWVKTEVKIGSKMVKVAGGKHVSRDGEEINHSGIHVVKDVDESEFLKIYTKNIKAIFDLKPTAQRVLQYLMVKLQKTPNSDAVYLSWIGAGEYFDENKIGVSRASFHRSLSELIDKGFLAESTEPNMFWFNPNLFFNGNRMTFIHEFRNTSAKKIEKKGNEEKSSKCPSTMDMFDSK